METRTESYGLEAVIRNERLSIINGCFAIIGMNMVTSFIPLFAIHCLHATDQQVGYLSSLPSIVGLAATLLGMMWMQRIRSKKWFCTYSTIVARICFLCIACIPWLPLHELAWVLVGIVALMKFPQSFGDLAWQSMIGDLIPERRRSGFFGKRNRALTIVGMLSTLIPGIILQRFPESQALPYQILFLSASVFAIMEVYYLQLHEEPIPLNPTSTKQTSIFQGFAGTFRDRKYMIFLVCSMVFNFGWQMAWPLFSLFQINTAHATALWISLFNVANQLAQIVTYSWWGRMADKYGNGKMLAVTAVGMAANPVLMILSTNLYYLIVMNLYSGVFVAGTTLLLFNELLRVTPEQHRTQYIAHYNIVIGLIGFVAPQVGVAILASSQMNTAMIVSTFIRLLGAVAFFGSLQLVAHKSLHRYDRVI
jgi:MFS family permease